MLVHLSSRSCVWSESHQSCDYIERACKAKCGIVLIKKQERTFPLIFPGYISSTYIACFCLSHKTNKKEGLTWSQGKWGRRGEGRGVLDEWWGPELESVPANDCFTMRQKHTMHSRTNTVQYCTRALMIAIFRVLHFCQGLFGRCSTGCVAISNFVTICSYCYLYVKMQM